MTLTPPFFLSDTSPGAQFVFHGMLSLVLQFWLDIGKLPFAVILSWSKPWDNIHKVL